MKADGNRSRFVMAGHFAFTVNPTHQTPQDGPGGGFVEFECTRRREILAGFCPTDRRSELSDKIRTNGAGFRRMGPRGDIGPHGNAGRLQIHTLKDLGQSLSCGGHVLRVKGPGHREARAAQTTFGRQSFSPVASIGISRDDHLAWGIEIRT